MVIRVAPATSPQVAPLPLRGIGLAGTVLAALLMTLLLTSFQPFISGTAAFIEQATGPNRLNQFGYSFLAVISVAGMAMLADRRRLAASADPAWLVVVACLVLASMHAGDRAAALRATLFNLAILLICLGVVAIPLSAAAFRRASAAAIGAVILFSYAGVLLAPSIAVHLAEGAEPHHAGLWRGVFSHKNVAGPAFAAFAFFGFYFWRCGYRIAGPAIALLSLLFVIQTGSKTTYGLILIVFLIVVSGRLLAWRPFPVLLGLITCAAAATLIVGSALSPGIARLVAAIVSDPTFTGRDTLWKIAIEAIAERPWLGYGFDSFWMTPVVTEVPLPFDADWDHRGIVNGHNNYLDMALFMGLPLAALLVVILCLRPLRDYLRCRPFSENRRLADLCLMILLFVMLNSLLESSWFRRADPTWVMMIIAVAGMRMACRMRF